MTLEQAAEKLGVHYMSAYRYVRTGSLPARQVGGRWAVEAKDLEQFLAKRSRPAKASSIEDPPVKPTASSRKKTTTALADRLERGDEGGAWQLLEEFALASQRPAAMWVGFLAEAMKEIGDRWERGTTSVGEEHQASVVAMRLIGRLGAQGRRRGRRKGTVIVAAAPGDRHGLPTAMASEVLRSNGFRVVDLGADVPADEMWAAATEADRLLAVGYCATTELGKVSSLELRNSVAQVRERVGCPVLIGGAAIVDEAHSEALGAQFWTRSVEGLVEAVEGLHSKAKQTPRPDAP